MTNNELLPVQAHDVIENPPHRIYIDFLNKDGTVFFRQFKSGEFQFAERWPITRICRDLAATPQATLIRKGATDEHED